MESKEKNEMQKRRKLLKTETRKMTEELCERISRQRRMEDRTRKRVKKQKENKSKHHDTAIQIDMESKFFSRRNFVLQLTKRTMKFEKCVKNLVIRLKNPVILIKIIIT